MTHALDPDTGGAFACPNLPGVLAFPDTMKEAA